MPKSPAPSDDLFKLLSRDPVREWIRVLRKAAREWAKEYTLAGDVILYKEVIETWETWLVENSHAFLGGHIVHPDLMTHEFTWHRVSKDIRPAMESKPPGYLYLPATNNMKGTIREERNMMLVRDPSEDDSREYIVFVRDIIRDVKLPSVRRRIQSEKKRANALELRVRELDRWAASARGEG